MLSMKTALIDTEPLTITRQPDELYRHPAGSSVYIKCETYPCTGVHYQWFKRKELLQGKTKPFLHLQNITEDDASFYTCRVSIDRQNCLFTNWAKLEILESMPEMGQITTQPCCPEQPVLGGILYLYCDAVGDPAPTFQWYKDSKLIPDATTREYFFSNLCHDDEGVYQCVASFFAGQAFSDRTVVKVCKERQTNSHRQPAGLHGRNPGPDNNPFFSPRRVSDKVALLIGNKEYKFF
ncbi:Mucosa-associated lymphoid tissue lymphoma translocation protein 1-like [Exaiptasia diaphana]|nr:Mucosa-associated lymphoid tissue lymphoma translocation protein 1-like [Exaiptasia diaphana]